MLSQWISGTNALADHPVALWLIAAAVAATLYLMLIFAFRVVRARLERRAALPGHGMAAGAIRVMQRTSWFLLPSSR
ncbi:hypothetical protein [Achromobacter sp.]|uniref:hypothetical protein n=1 Tax=Achromobacter sp. TaxID=134375 RepID=UPI00257AA794|nr:hypothetical protein [Achromobacter sp.]